MQTWRLATGSLLWREWEDEIVVYNDASGDTHRLDALAAEAFEVFLVAPADEGQLADRVAASLGLDRTAALQDAVAAIVQQFRSYGLIAPCEA